MRWLVADSLSCPEQFFCSHLDSYSHYLREAGEDARVCPLNMNPGQLPLDNVPYKSPGGGSEWEDCDVAFVLDRYAWGAHTNARKKIAQVAALCSPMPWEVRKPDGAPAYDLVISSIPWMVGEARKAGCRAEYQPLAFDTRARVCGMGVERDLGCIFIGTVGPNHQRRAALLNELRDVVTVLPPVYGREYFKALARAKAVFNVHAEWSRGAANNMRLFEAAGMGAGVVSDGLFPEALHPAFGYGPRAEGEDWTLEEIREDIADAQTPPISLDQEPVLVHHTYESRIPQLIAWARSL